MPGTNCQCNDNDNEFYFTLATSNSRVDKYRTVEKHIKTTTYNAKKTRKPS